MISRRRCRHIALQWQTQRGIQEYERRLADLYHIHPPRMVEIHHEMCVAMLDGYYDPPAPRIPSVFQRLFLHDWAPPEVDWPMNTQKVLPHGRP